MSSIVEFTVVDSSNEFSVHLLMWSTFLLKGYYLSSKDCYLSRETFTNDWGLLIDFEPFATSGYSNCAANFFKCWEEVQHRLLRSQEYDVQIPYKVH